VLTGKVASARACMDASTSLFCRFCSASGSKVGPGSSTPSEMWRAFAGGSSGEGPGFVSFIDLSGGKIHNRVKLRTHVNFLGTVCTFKDEYSMKWTWFK
jgi:hypothetical protein